MKGANYYPPARAAYNTFLRSMLFLPALPPLFRMDEYPFIVGGETFFNIPYQKNIHLAINSLDLFSVYGVFAFAQSSEQKKKMLKEMNSWMNAVRGLYIETS